MPSGIRGMTAGIRIDRSYRELPTVDCNGLLEELERLRKHDTGVTPGDVSEGGCVKRSPLRKDWAIDAGLVGADARLIGLHFDRCESSLLL